MPPLKLQKIRSKWLSLREISAKDQKEFFFKG